MDINFRKFQQVFLTQSNNLKNKKMKKIKKNEKNYIKKLENGSVNRGHEVWKKVREPAENFGRFVIMINRVDGQMKC